MQADRALWPDWANFLQRWGLRDLAAVLVDTAGPLSVLGAQVIYFGQPFLNQMVPHRNLTALAALFENQAEMKSFAAYLREDASP